jgi:hypothetical protein
MKKAVLFTEVTGFYHLSDDDLAYLDARGPGYKTKAAAMRAAAESGYTHINDHTYGASEAPYRIPKRYR